MGRQFNLALVAGLALPAAMALNRGPSTPGKHAPNAATVIALRDTTDSLYDTTAKRLPSSVGQDTLGRTRDSLQRRMGDTITPRRDTTMIPGRDTTAMPRRDSTMMPRRDTTGMLRRDSTMMPGRDTMSAQQPPATGKRTTTREKRMRRTAARTSTETPTASPRVHVIALQQELRDEGCGPSHATGRVDAATRRAIQCAHDKGLAKGNTVDELLASMDIAFSETQ